ncbi:MAG: T9SS type A sorting domain-containing protein [Balneolaceae bacterium]
MKRTLLLIFLFTLTTSFSFAQEQIKEAYFHELKGMEDSSGVTHLFYRVYINKVNTFECDGRAQTFYSSTNHIYHHIPSRSDSLKFMSYSGESCTGDDTRIIMDYDFHDQNPETWLAILSYGYTFEVRNHIDDYIEFHLPIVVKQNQQNLKNDYWPSEIYLSPNGDSLYVDADSQTIPFSGNGEDWPVFDTYDDFLNYADSLSFEYEVLGIHPVYDSLYFAKEASGNLYRSDNYSRSFNLSDSTGSHTKLAFDADSSVIYSLITKKQESAYIRNLLISDDFGKYGSWSHLTLPATESRFEFIQTDSKQAGHVFVADSNTVYSSDIFGDTFSESFTSDDQITGLYKKPDSEILYVLTREELLEVNTETQETTTLKQIPVSNEPEPSEAPKQITLEQNYPNPFNPTTVISYQLAVNSLVNLEVFDVMGRKVAVLVDGEMIPAGRHQVTFDASGLSSGIYFYRLQSAGQTFTHKMMLVK